MIVKIYKFLFLIIFILISFQLTISASEIIPKKKPVLSNQSTDIKISQNFVVPKNKPVLNKDNEDKEKNVEKEILKTKISKIDGIIIPKSKPLIVKKDKSVVAKKSKFYSQKDFCLCETSYIIDGKEKMV